MKTGKPDGCCFSKLIYPNWFLLFVMLSAAAIGQVVETDYLKNIRPELIKEFAVDSTNRNKVYLRMDFNDSKILNPKISSIYSGKAVVRV